MLDVNSWLLTAAGMCWSGTVLLPGEEWLCTEVHRKCQLLSKPTQIQLTQDGNWYLDVLAKQVISYGLLKAILGRKDAKLLPR